MKNYKIEIRAAIAIVAGVLVMLSARLVGANTATSVGAGVGVLFLVGFAFLMTGIL